jgi:hypothetical protein
MNKCTEDVLKFVLYSKHRIYAEWLGSPELSLSVYLTFLISINCEPSV